MFRQVVVLALLALAAAFGPARMNVRSSSLTMKADMSLQQQIGKFVIAAGLGLGAVAPQVVFADGAISSSTVYRARNNYGAKIYGLTEAAAKGDFAAFEAKKIVNAFDLFISQSNAKNGIKDKELKKAELAVQAKIYEAVKAKNAAGLKASFDDFVKIASLKSEFKPSDQGQTDSSGFSPTWGTERQQIYQR